MNENVQTIGLVFSCFTIVTTFSIVHRLFATSLANDCSVASFACVPPKVVRCRSEPIRSTRVETIGGNVEAAKESTSDAPDEEPAASMMYWADKDYWKIDWARALDSSSLFPDECTL